MNIPSSARLRRFYVIALIPLVVVIGIILTLLLKHPTLPNFAFLCILTLLFLNLLSQLHTGYSLEDSTLCIRSIYGTWRIPLKEIKDVSEPQFPIWKSLGQRVILQTTRGKTISTMPEDPQGFYKLLEKARSQRSI